MNSEATLISAQHGYSKHKNTNLYESHLWSQGKQLYAGGWTTSDFASRAYDISIIKIGLQDEGTAISPKYLLNYSADIYIDLLPALSVLSLLDVLNLTKEYARSISPTSLAKGKSTRNEKGNHHDPRLPFQGDPRGPRSVNSHPQHNPSSRPKSSSSRSLPAPAAGLLLPPPHAPPSSSLIHRPQAVRFHEASSQLQALRPSATASTFPDDDNDNDNLKPLSRRESVRVRRRASPEAIEMLQAVMEEGKGVSSKSDAMRASFTLHLMRGTISAASKRRRANERGTQMRSDDDDDDEKDSIEMMKKKRTRQAGRPVSYKEESSQSLSPSSSSAEEAGHGDDIKFKDESDKDEDSVEQAKGGKRVRVRSKKPTKPLLGIFHTLGSRMHPASASEAEEHERIARGAVSHPPASSLGTYRMHLPLSEAKKHQKQANESGPPLAASLEGNRWGTGGELVGSRGGRSGEGPYSLDDSRGLNTRVKVNTLEFSQHNQAATLVLGGSASAFSPPPPPAPPSSLPSFSFTPSAGPKQGLLLSAASPPMPLYPTFLLLSASRTPAPGGMNPAPALGPSSLEQLQGNLTDLLPLWT